jgi:hypothetical protein
MTLEDGWYDETERILLIVFERDFSLGEYEAMIRRNLERISTKPYTVDVIIDARQSRFLPMGFLLSSLQFLSKSPRNRGYVVLVRPTSMMQSILETVLRIFSSQRGRIILKPTLEEAAAYLQQRRSELSNGA